ncbi:hypothetical protein [Streptomyces sp. 7-21]|uniref:hypothetical protein n=1 Tax=Streptomyces sp. 7-21 TaxID=2802283 RepID=UPI00191D0EF8|nr:hypothetical protein [Streptomyces sp. 7-21]MBL1068903.1 hypothetical protein [Streptomyces sp. 7-21]
MTGSALPQRCHLRKSTLALLSTIALITACSGNANEDEVIEVDNTLTGEEVCGGILDREAADALEALAGTDRFSDIWGGRYRHSDREINVSEYAAGLRENDYEMTFCDIYIDEYFHPVASLKFRWSPAPIEDPESIEHQVYDTGIWGYATPQYASILFECPEVAPDGYHGVASVHGGDSTMAEKYMIVINSAARTMTEELGCLESANISESTPEPISPENEQQE